MVILVFFKVLKIAKVRPLVGQKGPYNPTSFLISLKLRSMLNLTLRLQKFHTLLSSKLWYHLPTIKLNRSNLSHEFIHHIADRAFIYF